MIDDRTHRAAPGSPSVLARRARAWLGQSADPPPPRPPRVRIDPVRRSWLAAFWQARVSVSARVPLDDYLRSRLARYLSALPVPASRLTVNVTVEDGELLIEPLDPEPGPAETANDPVAWLAPLVAAEGPSARHELKALEARLAALETDDDATRSRMEALERRLATDVASGAIAGPPIEATAEQMGRPVARSPWGELALLTLAAGGLVAETWQVAVPLLRAAGVDPHHLRTELPAQPIEVVAAILFALGVATGLFALTRATLETAVALSVAPADARRRGWLLAGAASAAVLGSVMAAAVVALPGDAPGAPAWASLVLVLAQPVGAALLLRAARDERGRRHTEREAALAWDRTRASALAERGRRLEELEWAEEERREVEAECELVRRRLRDLSGRALAVARRWAEAERRERADLARLGQSLVSALELDRYEFVRQASVRGEVDLFAPRRRPPSEPRPGAGAGPRPAEAGRLAG